MARTPGHVVDPGVELLGRLQELGFSPMGAPLWATSAFLSDQNVLGNFLTGRIGYRARPSTWEVIAYVAYLVIAAVLRSGRTPRAGGQWQQRAIESGALVLVECLLI